MTTRRDLLSTALTAAGVAVAPKPSHAVERHDPHYYGHDHDHQDVPLDPTLRVKALESLLVAKGLVDRAALDALRSQGRSSKWRAGGCAGVGRSCVQGALACQRHCGNRRIRLFRKSRRGYPGD